MYFFIRVFNEDGTPLSTRCEKASTPEEACKLAFGVVYNHSFDTARYYEIGSRKPKYLTQKRKIEIEADKEGWKLFTRVTKGELP